MDLRLEDLTYQREAIDAVVQLFEGQIATPIDPYNPDFGVVLRRKRLPRNASGSAIENGVCYTSDAKRR